MNAIAEASKTKPKQTQSKPIHCQNKAKTNPIYPYRRGIEPNLVRRLVHRSFSEDGSFMRRRIQNQPRRPDKSGGLIIDVADNDAYNTTIHL